MTSGASGVSNRRASSAHGASRERDQQAAAAAERGAAEQHRAEVEMRDEPREKARQAPHERRCEHKEKASPPRGDLFRHGYPRRPRLRRFHGEGHGECEHNSVSLAGAACLGPAHHAGAARNARRSG